MASTIGKLISGDDKWGFDIPVLSIGRSPEATLPIADDSASRIHSQLRLNAEGKYMLLDWGSKNGTYLNGKLITEPITLKSADLIQVGGQQFTFEGNTLPPPPSISEKAIIMGIALTPGYDFFLKSEPEVLSWMLGQWHSQLAEIISRLDGQPDDLKKSSLTAHWTLPSETKLNDILDTALQCTKECLTTTLHLGEEVLHEMRNPANPFLAASAGFHYGTFSFHEVGSPDGKIKLLDSEPSIIVNDIATRAASSARDAFSSKDFFRSSPEKIQGNPFTHAMLGPKRKSFSLHEIIIP